MYILGLIVVAILSSSLTLILHCILIYGKECEEKWEEEKTTKKGENKG